MWVYTQIVLTETSSRWASELNAMGRDGWECFSILWVEAVGANVAFFKKSVEP